MEKSTNVVYLSSYCKEKLEKLEKKILYEERKYLYSLEVFNNKIPKHIQYEKIQILKNEYENLYEHCVFK